MELNGSFTCWESLFSGQNRALLPIPSLEAKPCLYLAKYAFYRPLDTPQVTFRTIYPRSKPFLRVIPSGLLQTSPFHPGVPIHGIKSWRKPRSPRKWHSIRKLSMPATAFGIKNKSYFLMSPCSIWTGSFIPALKVSMVPAMI